MRATFEIGLKRYQAGTTDAHGNPVVGYAPIVGLPVYGHSPILVMEQYADRDDATTTLFVFAPAGTSVDPMDIVVIDGREYQLQGGVEDFTKGPYGAAMGVRFTVRRTEG